MAFGAWSQVFDPEVWSASQWGTKYYALRIYYRYRQDVAANITQFELQGFRFYTLTSARGIHGATLHGYFSVNYIDQGYKTVLNNMPSPPGNVYLPYNMTVDVPHNQDGTYNSNLYIAWRFYVTGSGDSIQPNIQTSQRVNPSIPKIPRVSSADVTSPSLTMGSKQTIKIGRQTTSYTHNLYYKFQGQGSWTAIASGVNADTYDWTVPTSLASLIPNATSGTCQILVRTMSGTTQIGDSIASFTANVPSSVVPSISSVAVAETTSGLATQFGAFIQSKSGYKCTISASGASGSTIKTYRVEMDGKSASGSGNVLTLPSTSSSGSLTLKTTVTDSRGRSATKSQTVSVLAYTGPKCSLAIARCNASGALDDEGTKIKITYNFAITALNNKNSRSLKIQWLNGSTWTDLMSKNDAYSQENTFTTADTLSFSVDKSYQIRAVCADYFGSVTVERSVDTSFSLIDLGSDGKSIAFGGVARDDGTLHSDIPSYFNKGLTVPLSRDVSNYGVPFGGSSTSQVSVANFCENAKSFIGTICKTDGVWWDVLSVRHRNGFSDGNNYGLYIATRLTDKNHSLIYNKQCAGAWGVDRTILDSNNFTNYINPYAHEAVGSEGTSGWVRVLRFTIKKQYINTPIKITLAQRQKNLFSELYIYFLGTNDIDPGLGSFWRMGSPVNARLTKVSTSTWDLYIQKVEAYDRIDIMDVEIPFRIKDAIAVESHDYLNSGVPGTTYPPKWGLLDAIYPVGSAILLRDDLNPNTLYGGTWEGGYIAFGNRMGGSNRMLNASSNEDNASVNIHGWGGWASQKWKSYWTKDGSDMTTKNLLLWARTA